MNWQWQDVAVYGISTGALLFWCWLRARYTRPMKLKIGSIEMEADTATGIKSLIDLAEAVRK